MGFRQKLDLCAVLLCPVIVVLQLATTPSTKKVHPIVWDPGFPEARCCVGALSLALAERVVLRTLHQHD